MFYARLLGLLAAFLCVVPLFSQTPSQPTFTNYIQSFNVLNAPPFGRTLSIWNITPFGAVVGARINPNNAITAYYLQFSSSNIVRTTDIRELEAGSSDFSSEFQLSGLNPSTRYEVRLVASNAFGIYRSSPDVFVTATNTAVTEFPGPFPVLSRNPSFLPMDMDQDGDIDLVISGASDQVGVVKVFLNVGGIFSEGASIPLPSFLQNNATVSATADFNNDALLDLILGNDYDMVLLLSSNRTFAIQRMLHELRAYRIFPGDADNDGDIDLVSSYSSPWLSLGLYANDNVNILRPTSLRFDRGQIAEWGDYDNDADNDLLVWGATNDFSFSPASAITRVFQSEADRRFTNIQASLPGSLNGATWADYDNDGDLDIALVTGSLASSSTSANELRLYRNDHTNGFTAVQTILADRALFFPQWIDFDRDGRSDLFVQQDHSAADRIRCFLNKGDQFLEQNLGLPLLTNIQAKFADIDGDLMPDLLLNVQATNNSQRLRVFRNNLVSTNPPPPVPLNLTSAVSSMSASLHWELSSSTQSIESSNSPAYTFNLRIGKTPGGSEIMSAMSQPLTGARLIPARGNAGQGQSWLIRDLLPGNYYWSVQSVDPAFNGSSFAAETSFTILPYERTPALLSVATVGTNLIHQLTIEGPTRGRAQIHHSGDLQTWLTNSWYIYIGDEPATFSTGRDDTRFYRFRLLD